MASAPRPPVTDLTPITFEVLLSLMAGPQHGYGIKLDIEARTGGEMSLGSGTLYQAIQRLERDGLIAASRAGRVPVDARRGRTYQIQTAGKLAVREHLRRLSRVVDYARSRRFLPETKA